MNNAFNRTGIFLIPFFLFFCSTAFKNITSQAKPYRLDIGVWLRKNPETSETWQNIRHDTTFHYYKQDYIPMFRLYTPRLIIADTNYSFLLQSKLDSYYKGKLIESNFKRGETYIHAGQNGWIRKLNKELLTIYISYRPKADTSSVYKTDSIRIKILLDRE